MSETLPKICLARHGETVWSLSGQHTRLTDLPLTPVCANKIKGLRACLIEDHFSANQGVEDDDLNVICLGGRIEGPELAWDLIQTFLAAEFSQASRHLRRLGKVAALEAGQK